MTIDFRDWLAPAEAARRLNVRPVTLRLWRRQGRIRAVRTPLGGHVIDSADIERLSRERAVKSGAEDV